MGCCFSTHNKGRRRRRGKGRGLTRGSAPYVIPVTGSSLGTAAHKYELGENARKEIAGRGIGNAFLIEKPLSQGAMMGIINPLSHLEYFENGTGVGSPSSRGSRREAFFDTENAFETESDDEYLSVNGDFISTTGNNVHHHQPSDHPPSSNSGPEMSKVHDWIAGASEAQDAIPSPPLEDEAKSTFPFGTRNGIAALVGSPQDSLRADEKGLNSGGSPRKSFHIPGTGTENNNKAIPGRHRWERAVSDLLGRRPTSGSSTSPSRNANANAAAHPSSSPGPPGESVKSSGDHKGVFDGLCLPRLRTTGPTGRSKSLSPMSFKKKSSSMMKFSFKRKPSADLVDDPELSSKYYVERPVAGSQVAQCSVDKPVDGCWSEVSSTQFSIRGKHYAKDKKKFRAPNFSAFVPIGVDLLMSAQKIDHIAQFVELPFQELANDAESIPALLIVNIQLPLYPPAIFMGDTDGEGLSLVLYFRLTNDMAKTAPPYFKDILKRFVHDETEKVKGLVSDSVIPFRDRLKIVARCVNPEEVPLSAAEKKVFANYNEKPVLSRPQHCFHRGSNYLEVDLDVHRFSYIARKGFDTFRERLKTCVLDIGLTIQGNRPEELPEQILGAVRLHKLDFGDYRIMQTTSSAQSVKSDHDDVGGATSPL